MNNNAQGVGDSGGSYVRRRLFSIDKTDDDRVGGVQSERLVIMGEGCRTQPEVNERGMIGRREKKKDGVVVVGVLMRRYEEVVRVGKEVVGKIGELERDPGRILGMGRVLEELFGRVVVVRVLGVGSGGVVGRVVRCREGFVGMRVLVLVEGVEGEVGGLVVVPWPYMVVRVDGKGGGDWRGYLYGFNGVALGPWMQQYVSSLDLDSTNSTVDQVNTSSGNVNNVDVESSRLTIQNVNAQTFATEKQSFQSLPAVSQLPSTRNTTTKSPVLDFTQIPCLTSVVITATMVYSKPSSNFAILMDINNEMCILKTMNPMQNGEKRFQGVVEKTGDMVPIMDLCLLGGLEARDNRRSSLAPVLRQKAR